MLGFFCVKPVQLCKLNHFFYIGPHFFLFSTSHKYQHMVFVSKIALYFGHIPPLKKKSQKHYKRRNKRKKKSILMRFTPGDCLSAPPTF